MDGEADDDQGHGENKGKYPPHLRQGGAKEGADDRMEVRGWSRHLQHQGLGRQAEVGAVDRHRHGDQSLAGPHVVPNVHAVVAIGELPGRDRVDLPFHRCDDSLAGCSANGYAIHRDTVGRGPAVEDKQLGTFFDPLRQPQEARVFDPLCFEAEIGK